MVDTHSQNLVGTARPHCHPFCYTRGSIYGSYEYIRAVSTANDYIERHPHLDSARDHDYDHDSRRNRNIWRLLLKSPPVELTHSNGWHTDQEAKRKRDIAERQWQKQQSLQKLQTDFIKQKPPGLQSPLIKHDLDRTPAFYTMGE